MIGKTILHYEILSKLGEGGMGVVYKAQDTKLDREVALKFLPSNSITTKEEKNRFQQEARAAAKLNHANIAHVYEINEHESQSFIAMEYVDGENLSERIELGPIKLQEATKIAIQIAEGLQVAHEQKITHRDIKSANIMLTAKGVVKIMDFGLAKLSGRTMVTKEGTTLGTASYMSPEQARGESADNRSDIWSLGVVLYEMISGQLPFKGDYEQAVVYGILNEDPEPLTALRSGVPLAMDGIVAKALAKEPSTRYQHIDELPADLKSLDLNLSSSTRLMTTEMQPTSSSSIQPKSGVPWQIVAPLLFITAVLTGLIIWQLKPATSPAPSRHLFVNAPSGQSVSAPVISPDGTRLVYVGAESGETRLYLRDLDQPEAQALAGTEGAFRPFMSPDGLWVGFFVAKKMMKVSLDGGSPITLTDDVRQEAYGAVWRPNDTIVFSDKFGNLVEMASSGGDQTILTPRDTEHGELDRGHPATIPGSPSLLFTIRRSFALADASLASLNPGNGEIKTLLEHGLVGTYLPTGHLAYWVSTDGDLRLMASRFDSKRLEPIGTPVPILEGVLPGNMSYSQDGTLVYVTGGAETDSRFMLVDRQGRRTDLIGGRFWLPSFSPDGSKLAFLQIAEGDHVWIYDIESKTFSPFTSEGINRGLAWSPDGSHIAFGSFRNGIQGIYTKPVDGSTKAKLIYQSKYEVLPLSWSPDDKLAFYQIDPERQRDVWVYDLAESTATTFLATPFNERGPVFSPDGEWIAYVSDESGSDEVWVQSYPATGEKHQISSDGAFSPKWAPGGKELFFRRTDQIIAIPISTQNGFRRTGPPRSIIEGDYSFNVHVPNYDIHPDGKRFLVEERDVQVTSNQIHVVTNWFKELERLLPKE